MAGTQLSSFLLLLFIGLLLRLFGPYSYFLRNIIKCGTVKTFLLNRMLRYIAFLEGRYLYIKTSYEFFNRIRLAL